MNKELEAWQEIKLGYICGQGAINEFALRENEREKFKIIETTLNNYEQIKNICESYGIEFNLVNIKEALFTLAQLKGEKGNNWENYNKKLKALKIIKEKRVDVFGLICCMKLNEYTTLETYNLKENCHNYCLTQEEFDLLKEVLEGKE